ncbi:hypothetical protein KP509_11G093700 [Ceratopteris richardii]|uniref:NAD-dependent epimerase/dehydratase domain-containing protein n=2 Tax=Ceratopteris richardii TaxID=49495 RepID=A0A8T2TTW0_CERRI|nr:hypothetical protein KP509_11G093700 [Ceratopteris richardii]KAH7426282.1 hypothetical protein KP509_11G093700 [Ceratopteris richardii]
MNQSICVTGASGFIASWTVKLLLESGYHVHGFVRSPDDKEKNGHLENFEGATGRLTLFKGDLLDCDSLFAAISGCTGVFHIACPVLSYTDNPEVELLTPAVQGTLNVLEVSKMANVRRVVMTSSVTAMTPNPNMPSDAVLDESCWSDEDYLRKNNFWYMLGKTLGEKAAWEYAQNNGIDLITICPCLVLGPLLQAKPNATSFVVLTLLNGSTFSRGNTTLGIVDVRDVAKAHLLAYETEAASGRYLCRGEPVTKAAMVEILRRLYPDYPIPSRITEPPNIFPTPREFSDKIVDELGLEYMPLETTLNDTVASFKEKGLLL